MTTVGQVEASIILDALRAALGPDVPILGGGASPKDPADDPRHGNFAGWEIAGDVVTNDAIAILLFCGPLAVSYGVDTGWRGVGPMATVTGVSADSVVRDRRAAGARVLRAVPRHGRRRRSPTRSRCSTTGDTTAVLPAHPDRVRPGDGLRELLRLDPRWRDGPADRRRDRRDLRRRPGVDRRRAGHLPGRSHARRGADLLVRDPPLPPRDARPARDRGRPRRDRHWRRRSRASTAWARSRRWRSATRRASTTRRWSRSCSAPCDRGWLRRAPGRRPRTRQRPSPATPRRSSARTGSSPADCTAWRTTSAASRSSATPTRACCRRSPRTSRRSGLDRSAPAQRAAAADHRPAQRRRDADRRPPRRRDGAVQRRRRVHRDLVAPADRRADRGAQRAVLRLRRDLRGDGRREDQDHRRRLPRDRRPGRGRRRPCVRDRRGGGPDGRARRGAARPRGTGGRCGSGSTAARSPPA